MAGPTRDDPARYPAIGRWLTWVDRPGSPNRIFWGLAVFCGFLLILDFTYEKHGHFAFEDFPEFFAIYGYVMFTLLILAAKGLRALVKKPEDFYGDKAVDREEYPADQLDKVDYDA